MKPERPTWLEIDLGAISNNIQRLRTLIPPTCILMGVVKANAYGHGAVKVAQTIASAGVSRLAVATLSEAIELRKAAIGVPILVLGYTPTDLIAPALAHDIALTVYDTDSLNALEHRADEQATKATVHLKVNTGMNRLGLRPHECLEFLTHLSTFSNIQAEGIYTHFASADEADQSFAVEQFTRFEKVLAELEAAKLRPPIAHAANSAATLSMPETHLDMVRPGIAMYGLHPDPKSNRLPPEFRPALTWKAQVAHINHLVPGETVSYGREFRAEQPTSIAILPIGYADGFPRKPRHWAYVLLKGEPMPIVGRVCMDQTMIDISSLHSPEEAITSGLTDVAYQEEASVIKQGDEVVLIGQQDNAYLSADAIAEQIGTNNYDVVSRILSRVPRVYV